MTRIPLTLGRHYLLIDSPISFYLVDNEENSVYRPSGVWQLDTWKLLPEKYQKDHPVYTLSIEYDENKLADGKEVLIRESDIDLGDGVAGVSGQAVMLTGINDSLLPIPVSVNNIPDIQKVNVQNNPTEIAVNNFPDVQKVTVQNIPGIQKVNVQNNPTEIAVNNIPGVQNVNSCLRTICGDMSGEPFSFTGFLNFLDTHKNIHIDFLVFNSGSENYLVYTWSLISAEGSFIWVGIARKFSDNSLATVNCVSNSSGSKSFLPFYHVI